MGLLKAVGAVAFSDDGVPVSSSRIMRMALEYGAGFDALMISHCEDKDLAGDGVMNEGENSTAFGLKGISRAVEEIMAARDIILCETFGGRLHLAHISTKGTAELVRQAKKRGVNVTCETAPHYLAFTQDDLQEDGRFKMNPPLREQADQDALIEGLLDGTIDMLVTDHAPHSHEEKAKGLEKSAMGVVGLETSFAASYTHLVKKGILPLEKLVELMHTSPMRRFGCGTEIAVGQPADLTVFDLNETYTVDPEKFLTMGRATPFTGTHLTGACKLTMIGGEIVWKEDTL
jgi:dihydroorotase